MLPATIDILGSDFWSIDFGTSIEVVAVLIALPALILALRETKNTVRQARDESRERAAYEAMRPLRMVRSNARTVVAELNNGHALLGIGPHLRSVLARFDEPPTWATIDNAEASKLKLADIAVREAWFTSPGAAPLIEAATSMRTNAQALGGGLAFLEPAAAILSAIALGTTEPTIVQPAEPTAPAAGVPALAGGVLYGPLGFLSMQLQDKDIRKQLWPDTDLEQALLRDIPMNAAAALVGLKTRSSSQHSASLWLLRLIEIAVSSLEEMPTVELGELAAASQHDATTKTWTDELTGRLGPLRKLNPNLAEHIEQHAQEIARLLERPQTA